MDISVIVCTFNRAHLLRGSLEALRRQEVSPHLKWELIVVDNNCTDDTADVVASAAASFPTLIRRVSEMKQGLSNARNRGIVEARGSYLLFTDDDTRPMPDWVQCIWNTFRTRRADAIGGKVDLLWPNARPAWFADELISSLAGVDYGNEELELNEERPPLGANMAFSRKVFEVVGNFDPELGRIGAKLIGGEETDLFRRMYAAGMKGIYQPRAIVRHVVEPGRLRKSYFREIYLLGGRTSSRSFTPRPGRRIGGVPLFLFRQVFEKFAASFRSKLARKPDRAFMEQLQALWLVGLILGCASRATRKVQERTAA